MTGKAYSFRSLRSAKERGFTLLEAIVAVAILGIAIMPLLSFISQAVQQLYAAGESNARSFAQQNVIAFLEPLNPLAQPTGQTELGDLRVEWISTPAVPENVNNLVGTSMPYYTVGFYRVDVRVFRGGADPWFTFTARKVGYQRDAGADPFGGSR